MVGSTLLWLLASAAVVLLGYEFFILITAVWYPLLLNPHALQTDFHYYYEAALRFSADSRRLYLPGDDVMHGFMYPPPAILLFVWLSRVPLGAGLLVMTVASYLALIGALQCWSNYLRRHGHSIDRSTNAAVLLIAVALGPTYMNALFGQVNGFVLATAVLFATMAMRAPLLAGVVLAVGAWLKIYPLLMAMLGLWERRAWRAIVIALVASVAVVFALTPIVPLQAYTTFFSQVLPSRSEQSAIHVINQSLTALLERFRYPASQFLYWTGEQGVKVSVSTRIVNILVAASAIAWLARRGRSGEPERATAGLMALVAVAAPVGWGHTYVMVLPLVVLQLVRMQGVSTTQALIVFMAVAALFIPAGRHLPLDGAPDWLQNILYSRYLLATFVLMMVPLDAEGRETISADRTAAACSSVGRTTEHDRVFDS